MHMGCWLFVHDSTLDSGDGSRSESDGSWLSNSRVRKNSKTRAATAHQWRMHMAEVPLFSIIFLLRWVFLCWVSCRIADLGMVIGFSDLIRNHFSHKLLVAIMGTPTINCTCPRCNCRIDLASIRYKDHFLGRLMPTWQTHARGVSLSHSFSASQS